MTENPRELPRDRPATMDAEGARVSLYPAEVRGKWASRRKGVQWILLFVFLFLPWLSHEGRQWFLLDIAQRRFHLFGVQLWAHDVPLLWFVLVGSGVALLLVTSIWGRVWCGWACPQTVFIEALYRQIESWIEGDSVSRKRRDTGPWTFDKVLRKSAKYAVYFGVTLLLTHSFLAYFVGAHEVTRMVFRAPSENWLSFVFVMSLSGLLLFNFAWFREQFCVIVCPYGRLQSVFLDEHSLVVHYDAVRGEPRKGMAPSSNAKSGDCVNCYKCVQVCPTGVDIRRGTQLECIACTACIDACDEVMSRLKKPLGLIRYDSLAGTEGRRKVIRPRVILYASVWVALVAGFGWTLARHEDFQMTIVRAVESPYQVLPAEGAVMNHFKVDFSNQAFEERKVRITLPSALKERGFVLITQSEIQVVAPGKSLKTHYFVKFPASALTAGSVRARLNVEAFGMQTFKKRSLEKEVTLVGPLR